MRIKPALILIATAIVACVFAAAPRAIAQHPDAIPADQSAAMAKEIFQHAIEGLGGAAYLGVRDSECTGRLSQFGQLTGELGGYIEFRDLRILPDKLRREFTKKAPIIDVYNGDKGWTYDKGGVDELDAVGVAAFNSSLKIGLEYILRHRLTEPNLYFHYGGLDVVDLKQADWAEMVDNESRSFKLAVDRATHLPIQFVVTTVNANTHEEIKDTTFYSNWHPQDGVQTPFQVSRIRDGKRVFQSFYYGCKYNTGLSPDLFTRESLDKRWKDTGHKK